MTIRSLPALAVGGLLATTLTLVEVDDDPPAPVHAKLKVVVALTGPVDAEPLGPRGPLQPPLAVQLVALEVVQVSVELPPAGTVGGNALNVIWGKGGVTTTAAVADPEPPAPVHVNVKLALAFSAAEPSLPLVGLFPVQPPLAVQLVAFVDDHVRMVDDPVTTEAGLAVRATVGVGGAVTVTDALAAPEPPVPEHVKVKVALAARAAVVSVPLVALAPVQPPEAVHDVALVLDQASAVVVPEVTLAGLADRVTVGAGTGAGAEPPPPPQAARATEKRAGIA